MRLGATPWALVLAVGMLPTPARAQTVLIRATDVSTAGPLQGVLVVLTDPAGAHVRSALTDPRGQFLFAGIAPGPYTVRAELIGFSTMVRTVTVADRETALVELKLESRAIELEGLSVEAEGRCSLRPEAGLRVAEVWDEIRKALEAARWTDEHGVYEYRTRRYLRDVEEQTGLVLNQESSRGRVYLSAPYESRPAHDLMENGFIQSPTDGSQGDLYFAPDASVLLSDIFLDSHCMRLRAGDGDEAGLVGLAFEPVRGRRIPDISGTLWVDPNSWQLSHLEYLYENTPPNVQTRGIGGEVTFQLLPDGTWIVPEWRIRMPLLALGRDFEGRETVYQYGYREQGAAVLTAREPGGDVVFSASTASLEGVVLEELTSEPVAGAVVSLVGTDYRVTTDAEGLFRLVGVVPGRYDVMLEHPAMQAHGYEPEPVGVVLAKADVASVMLTLPSPLTLQEATCPEQIDSRPHGSAILVGRVTDRESGMGLEGARVRIEWDDFWLFRVQLAIGEEAVVATTGPDGRYRACVVPGDALLRIRAQWEHHLTVEDTIRIPGGDPSMGYDITIRVGSETATTGTALATDVEGRFTDRHRSTASPDDVDNIDVEDENGSPGDVPILEVAKAESWRDDYTSQATDSHPEDASLKALNDLVVPQDERVIVGVEEGAAGEPAIEADTDFLTPGQGVSFAHCEVPDVDTAFQDLHGGQVDAQPGSEGRFLDDLRLHLGDAGSLDARQHRHAGQGCQPLGWGVQRSHLILSIPGRQTPSHPRTGSSRLQENTRDAARSVLYLHWTAIEKV